MALAPAEDGGWQTEPGRLVSRDYMPRMLRVKGHPGQDAPRGVYFRLTAGKGALVQVTCTDHPGGTGRRTFSLTPRGAWLSLVGWERLRVEVLGVSDAATVVEWGFTSEMPPKGQQLLYVAALDSSGNAQPVPEGAASLAPSVALPAFAWQCNSTGGASLVLPAPQLVGTLAPVLGGLFVNAVPNVVACWILDPL